MKKLVLTIFVSILSVIGSFFIMESWISEVFNVFGYFTWVILIGMVFIPCFYTFFVATSLLFSQKIKNNLAITDFPKISILIAVYNEENNIVDTIKSIREQDYPNSYEVVIVDDGSTDNTVENIKQYLGTIADNNIILVDNKINKGKASALNSVIDKCSYDTLVSLDSDTILYENALKNLINKFKSDDYSAVAGSVRVGNHKSSWITRLQKYDYLYGIASVKQCQGVFNTTLVAQGAFSCYKKSVVKELKWAEIMGEDIVLTWDMLSRKNKIGYANDAIVYTNAPETYTQFFKQRKRWSIGLVEAFRRNWSVLTTPSLGLPFFWNNFLFIYIDLSYLLFLMPSILLALFFQYYLMAGILTLLLIPLGLILTSIIMLRQNSTNKKLGIKNDFNLFDFIVFILVYQTIQTPACVIGYFSEIFKMKKNWGTR